MVQCSNEENGSLILANLNDLQHSMLHVVHVLSFIENAMGHDHVGIKGGPGVSKIKLMKTVNVRTKSILTINNFQNLLKK